MVKCEDCGFLALRNQITGLLDEASQEYRWRAEVPTLRNPNATGVQKDFSSFFISPYTGVPICLVRAYPLHNEFANQEQATNKEIFNLLVKERHCDERGLFTPWQQSFTPKEHREMLDRQKLLEREDNWQEFQAQMAADDRKWREEQEIKAEERHQRELQTIKDINKTQMWIMGGLVTLIIVLVTLLGGAIEAGWVPEWFGIGQPQAEQSTTSPTLTTQEIQPQESP
jgi:hypothetical protein